jgi:hypothetical protein
MSETTRPLRHFLALKQMVFRRVWASISRKWAGRLKNGLSEPKTIFFYPIATGMSPLWPEQVCNKARVTFWYRSRCTIHGHFRQVMTHSVLFQQYTWQCQNTVKILYCLINCPSSQHYTRHWSWLTPYYFKSLDPIWTHSALLGTHLVLWYKIDPTTQWYCFYRSVSRWYRSLCTIHGHSDR